MIIVLGIRLMLARCRRIPSWCIFKDQKRDGCNQDFMIVMSQMHGSRKKDSCLTCLWKTESMCLKGHPFFLNPFPSPERNHSAARPSSSSPSSPKSNSPPHLLNLNPLIPTPHAPPSPPLPHPLLHHLHLPPPLPPRPPPLPLSLPSPPTRPLPLPHHPARLPHSTSSNPPRDANIRARGVRTEQRGAGSGQDTVSA